MFPCEKKYWFTIEPYTYVYGVNGHLILFNTLNGAIVETDNEDLIKLVEETLNSKNLSVSLLNGEQLSNVEILNFVNKLRDKFMGDLIDLEYSNHKPIQFISDANIIGYDYEQQKSKFLKNIENENIISYLDEITLMIVGSAYYSSFIKQTWLCDSSFKDTDIYMPFEYIKELVTKLNSASVSRIRVIGSNIFSHPHIIEIMELFDTLPVSVEYIQNGYVSFSCLSTKCKRIIFLHASDLGEIVNVSNNKCAYIFSVVSEGDLLEVERFILQNQINNYKMIPYYTGHNLSFFEKNIYLNKDDLEDTAQELKDIYAKQFINLNYFGKLFVSVQGNIYSNLFDSPLGNIHDDLKKMIHVELVNGKFWTLARRGEPCSSCVFRWLCPSPSNYEIAIGKCNLCQVDRN